MPTTDWSNVAHPWQRYVPELNQDHLSKEQTGWVWLWQPVTGPMLPTSGRDMYMSWASSISGMNRLDGSDNINHWMAQCCRDMYLSWVRSTSGVNRIAVADNANKWLVQCCPPLAEICTWAEPGAPQEWTEKLGLMMYSTDWSNVAHLWQIYVPELSYRSTSGMNRLAGSDCDNHWLVQCCPPLAEIFTWAEPGAPQEWTDWLGLIMPKSN